MPFSRTMRPGHRDEDARLRNALREAGRNFQSGKRIDTAALRRLIELRKGQWPAMCDALLGLISAVEDAHDDRESALKFLRVAIEVAESRGEVKKQKIPSRKSSS